MVLKVLKWFIYSIAVEPSSTFSKVLLTLNYKIVSEWLTNVHSSSQY